MITSPVSARTALLLGAMALASLAGCDAANTDAPAAATGDAPAATADAAAAADSDLDPILANPQVGDLWAADLSEFSAADFQREGRPVDKAYGLLKVADVTDDRVTVITETGFWEEQRGSLSDLRGTLSDISWDENERIPVNRSDFADMLDDGRIIETRRLEGAAAAPAAAVSGKPAAGE